MRIVLANYDGEHNNLYQISWRAFARKASGGYESKASARRRKNAKRKRFRLSPACLAVEFGEPAAVPVSPQNGDDPGLFRAAWWQR